MPVLGQLDCGIVSGLAARKNTVQICGNIYLVQFCTIAQIYINYEITISLYLRREFCIYLI